jgi:hypothetical protein
MSPRHSRDYGIPAASIMEPIVGVLETLAVSPKTHVDHPDGVRAGGALPSRVASGLSHGSPVPSDTLAPALLVAMIYLIPPSAARVA